VLYVWDLAFNRQNFGRAATVAWLLFIIIVAIGALNFYLSSRIASVDDARADRRHRKRQARILAQRRAADAAASTLAGQGSPSRRSNGQSEETER
jgi:cellobiose transport system permease protein